MHRNHSYIVAKIRAAEEMMEQAVHLSFAVDADDIGSEITRTVTEACMGLYDAIRAAESESFVDRQGKTLSL